MARTIPGIGTRKRGEVRSRRAFLLAGRRPLLAAAAVAGTLALALTVTGTSLSLLSAKSQTSATSSLMAGKSGLAAVAGPTTAACTVSGILPGKTGTCKLKVTYTGVKAYLGADILIATKAGTLPVGVPTGTVAKPLYDNSATGLQLRLVDSNATVYFATAAFTGLGTKFRNKTGTATTIAAITCPVTFPTYTNCYRVTDLLVRATAVTTSTSDTFTVSYKLPTTSTSGYEASTAKVVLSVHGVQFGNQTATGCTAGRQCPAETGFAWS